MNYLFHQHYRLQSSPELLPQQSVMPKVLLVEREPEALALYAQHLAKANLLVNVCLELLTLLRHVEDVKPHLLIINPTPDLPNTLAVLKKIQQQQPSLPIITVGAPIPDVYLDRLMATGVALHINRYLSQPRDIAVAAKQILGLN